MEEPFDSESQIESSDKPQRIETAPNTFAALRHRNFQLYFGGQLISNAGTWMQVIAQGWLVYQLTHSDLALGIVGFAAAVPALIVSPLGWSGSGSCSEAHALDHHAGQRHVAGIYSRRIELYSCRSGMAYHSLGRRNWIGQCLRWPRQASFRGGNGGTRRFAQCHCVEFIDDQQCACDWPGIRRNFAGSCRRGLVLYDQRDFFPRRDHRVMGDAGQASPALAFDGIPVEAIGQRHSIRFQTN